MMTKRINLFDVITALQYSKVWLEFFRNEALERAEEVGIWQNFFCDDTENLDVEVSITACHVYDPKEHDILEQLSNIRNLKIALQDYLPNLTEGEFYKERKDAILTAFKLLNAQIEAMESYSDKEQEKIFVCLEIDPKFETEISEAIHCLEIEAVNLMKAGLGFKFTPPNQN